MATYDIHYQLLPIEEQKATAGKLFSFGFTAAVAVSGQQKMVNRWLKCFLTPKYSDPVDRLYGTAFSDLLGSNVNDTEFSDTVLLAVEDCNNQMRRMDRSGALTAEERLSNGNLDRIVPLGADGYSVYVTITSEAGVSSRVAVPVTV